MAAAFPRIDQFEIISVLGQGEASTVYKARQLVLDRVVALKVLTKLNENNLERFKREAKFTSTLDHPNIVKTLGYGVSIEGLPYLILEYLEGRTLEEEIDSRAPFSYGRTREIFLPVLSALAYAHGLGIVHRDIKPANIMLLGPDHAPEIKLLDFGVAKIMDQTVSKANDPLTRTGIAVGSPAYMSPEQCIGKEVDQRSDIYAISCVLYQSLTGQMPFSGDSALETMQSHLNGDLTPAIKLMKRMHVAKGIRELLLRGLAKDAAQRPESVDKFTELLKAELNKVDQFDSPQSRETKAGNAKHGRIMMLAGLSTLALLGAGAFLREKLLNPQSTNNGSTAMVVHYLKQSADSLSQQGKFEEALLLRKEGISKLRTRGARAELMVNCIKAANDCIKLSEKTSDRKLSSRYLKNGLEYVNEARNNVTLQNLSSFKLLVDAKLKCLCRLGELDEAKAYALTVQEEAASFPSVERFALYITLCDFFSSMQLYSEAEAVLRECLNINTSDYDPYSSQGFAIRIHARQAFVFWLEGKKEEARRLALMAVSELSKYNTKPDSRIEILQKIRQPLQNPKDYEKVLKSEIHEKIHLYEHDHSAYIILFGLVGEFCLNEGEAKEALEYFEKARDALVKLQVNRQIDIARDSEFRRRAMGNLKKLVEAASRSNDLPKISKFEKELQILKEMP